jgi:hypothetical protein
MTSLLARGCKDLGRLCSGRKWPCPPFHGPNARPNPAGEAIHAKSITESLSPHHSERRWACGPPMEMKVPLKV